MPQTGYPGCKCAGAGQACRCGQAGSIGGNFGKRFPKVDGQAQKARDSDRRQILQNELRMEEGKLASLKTDYNNGEPERRGDERNYAKYQERAASMKDDIARAESNVEALRRELARLR